MHASNQLLPAEDVHTAGNAAPGAGGVGNYVGRRIGRYVLLSLLGEGSMGSVWVADDPLLNIKVALKLLKPAALGNHGAERLLREARAVAQVKHPSIVQMLDFGVSQEGEPYLALELLEGETVRSFAGTGDLTPEMVVALALPLLDGLSVAHENGIVHRDIKPDNLFVARDARGRIRPKVLDFGISKSLIPQRECLTKIGTLIGTPAYMAPEQMRGDLDIDPRADLWALTVTIYELIAGFTPFTGATVQLLMMAVFDQQPRSLLGVPGVDGELAAILVRGLAKDRALRFPDARTMGNALASWLLARGVQEDACGTSLRAAWLMPSSAVADRLASRPSMVSSNPELVNRMSGIPMTGLETAPSLAESEKQASDAEIAQASTWLGSRPSGLPTAESAHTTTAQEGRLSAIPAGHRGTVQLAAAGVRTAVIPVVSSSLSWIPNAPVPSSVPKAPPPSWVPSESPSWVPGVPMKGKRFMPAVVCSALLAAVALVGAWASSSAVAVASEPPQVVAMSAPEAKVETEAKDEKPAPSEPAPAVESPAPAPVKAPAVSVSGARSAEATPPRVNGRGRTRRAWY